MDNFILALKNKIACHRVKDMNAQNCARAYRNSPEDVMLQLRRTNDYIGVALQFDEARRIGKALIAAADEGKVEDGMHFEILNFRGELTGYFLTFDMAKVEAERLAALNKNTETFRVIKMRDVYRTQVTK